MHQRDLRAAHLAHPSFSTQLPDSFDDVEKTTTQARMSSGQQAAVGSHWQLPAQADTPAFDKTPAFSLGAKTQVFQFHDHGNREAVINFGDVDVTRLQASPAERHLPGIHGAAGRQAFCVADMPVTQAISRTQQINRFFSQVAGAVGTGYHHRGSAIRNNGAVENMQRRCYFLRIQYIIDRNRIPFVGIRVYSAVGNYGDRYFQMPSADIAAFCVVQVADC